MINFIICDDIEKYRTMIKRVIVKYMMKNKLEYKTHIFKDYDEEFLKIINKKLSFKIYILDIEAPSMSGIDIARIIRKKDTDSVLIFLTGHQELTPVIMKNDFLFLSFINKFENCEERLYETIDKALHIFGKKKVIKFKDNGIIYTIPLEDILYITRDSIDRKCLLVTDYNKFKLSKNLNEIEELLDDNFIKTHRACFMNTKRIRSYNKRQRIVTFDNGMSNDLISSRFDKELI